MSKIKVEELKTWADEYRLVVPLNERIKEVDKIADEYRGKPLLVAVMEILLMGPELPIHSLRYLPIKFVNEGKL
jgi:hypothetical protein